MLRHPLGCALATEDDLASVSMPENCARLSVPRRTHLVCMEHSQRHHQSSSWLTTEPEGPTTMSGGHRLQGDASTKVSQGPDMAEYCVRSDGGQGQRERKE